MNLVRLERNENTLVLEHFNLLSDSSMRSRFGFSPSPATLVSYAHRMFEGAGAVLAVKEDGRVVALAHLSFEEQSCELGISILDERQGCGIGRFLMDESLRECALAGIKTMHLLTVAHNFKVLRLLRAYPHRINSGLDGSMAAIDVDAWEVAMTANRVDRSVERIEPVKNSNHPLAA